MTKVSNFDAADFLADEEAIAAYLNAALAEGETQLLLQALKDVANTRSMTKLVK